ncbi:NADPH-dependent F420 reductase [Asanoa siamensis]|uniref:NADPH-dependent F420 reductase n=1 Tax=Asanoa siamensis TaxID=926357 RepID=A0ABQ4CK88_9ACTN|nr:NADPH-dependent F420 reductase [Asanoa siamensis]GIF71717.1 NADPH-dependent F420 reductase [Asanoa siamensis]
MAYDPSALPDVSGLTVAIIGGTGDQGRGLAYRFARAGQRVLIGSRQAARAAASAEEISALPGVSRAVEGGANADVAAEADLTIIAVPWAGHHDTVAALRLPLAGKLVVDCVNPLGFDSHGPYPLHVEEGSAAQQAAALLPESTVAAAFNHVSAPLLADPAVETMDLDVLICTEDRHLAGVVAALTARIPGMRGIYAGRLRNAHQVEALTANLIAINRRYKAHAGLRVTDV